MRSIYLPAEESISEDGVDNGDGDGDGDGGLNLNNTLFNQLLKLKKSTFKTYPAPDIENIFASKSFLLKLAASGISI